MNELKVYKVVFEDGTIGRVYGKWAAHAWGNAKLMWPSKEIRSLQVLARRQTQ